MKRLFYSVFLIMLVFLYFCTGKNNFPALKGEYLGQKPPGLKPEIFASGIISTGFHDYCSIFSPDGKEFYFCLGARTNQVITFMHLREQYWSYPQTVSFSGQYNDSEMFMSHDGNKIVYKSNRPVDGLGTLNKRTDIWMVQRKDKGWGLPENLGPVINSDSSDFYPAFAKNGDLYFASDREGESNIYISRNANGSFMEPVKLGEAVNSEYEDWDACPAPDDSYIIFGSYNRPDGCGKGDL